MKKKLTGFSIRGKETKVVNKRDLALLFGFLQSAEESTEKLLDRLQDARVIVHKMGKDYYRGDFLDRERDPRTNRLGTGKDKKMPS